MSNELAPLTTLRVGGPAARLVTATTRDELVDAAREVRATGDDRLVLGGGSNVVISDEGYDGTVVRVATRGIRRDGAHLHIEAGEPWDAVVAFAVEHGLAGVETLSGIPGSTGAAPMQNIGAYGREIGSHLVAIDFLDDDTAEIVRLSVDELELGYRTSALKQGRLGVVLGVELELTEGDGISDPIEYDQLARELGVPIGARVPLADVRAAVLRIRASKGMVLDPADPDSVSAGSFFTNPIVSEHFARSLPADAPRWPLVVEPPAAVLPLGADLPTEAAPTTEYLVKLSAAWLIEHSGVARGFALPGSGAAISSKHTLAIVNRGGATADDVAELARYVQTRVLSEFGVVLQPEPVLVGIEL